MADQNLVPTFAGYRDPAYTVTLANGQVVALRGMTLLDATGAALGTSANPLNITGGGSGGSGGAVTAAANSYATGFSPDVGKIADVAYTDNTGQASGGLVAISKAQFVALSAVTKQLVSYVLATNGTANAAITPAPGSYALNLPATFNGATATVTFTASNGTTTTASYTAQPATPPRFDLFAGTSVSIAYSGGTPSGNTTFSGGPSGSSAGAATDASVQQVVGNTKPVTRFLALTVGSSTAIAGGIGIAIACTASGNAVLQAPDGSQITVPLNVGFTQLAFAIVKVVSQTATASYTNLY